MPIFCIQKRRTFVESWGRVKEEGVSGVQEFRSSGVQDFRSSGVQEFRSSGVQEFRSSGVQEFRSSGVQEFRSSGVQAGAARQISRIKSSVSYARLKGTGYEHRFSTYLIRPTELLNFFKS